MAQTVSPDFLLQTPSGWYGAGKRVLRQIDPAILPHVQLDGYEWFDVRGLGLGGTQVNVDTAVQRFRAQAQMLGSDLYAYALVKRTDLDIAPFGIPLARVDRYRLILCHSQAQLIFWFAVALGALVSAIILFQYTTSGNSPAADQLSRFWGGIMQQAGSSIGTAAAGASQPFVWIAIAGGVAILLFAVVQKDVGVQGARPPRPNISARTGPITAGVA